MQPSRFVICGSRSKIPSTQKMDEILHWLWGLSDGALEIVCPEQRGVAALAAYRASLQEGIVVHRFDAPYDEDTDLSLMLEGYCSCHQGARPVRLLVCFDHEKTPEVMTDAVRLKVPAYLFPFGEEKRGRSTVPDEGMAMDLFSVWGEGSGTNQN